MQKFSTWMILSIAVVFWILRIVATYTTTMGMDFIIQPLNIPTEISLLFIALAAFVLIAKRKLLGSVIYMVAYGGYFGVDLYNCIINNTISADNVMNVFFSFIGVLLPIFVLFDLLLDKNRKAHPKDKKTDWFYKGEKFDRDMDERADKNNYRTL